MDSRKLQALLLLSAAMLAPRPASAAFTARHSHAVTLLPEGNVLISGGRTGANTATDSVQTYDMATNTYVDWTAGGGGDGGLVVARSSHTATLMSDGRVLIAGGFGSNGQPVPVASSYEICDPKTRSCAAAGVSAKALRGGHTATLLSTGINAGKVLLCGGQSGSAMTTITDTCETFSAGAAVAWAGSMVAPREGHTATLMRGGRVFVSGGRRFSGAWLYEPMNEMYDPAADTWTPVSSLLQGRINHTATVLNNGTVLIAGGYNGNNMLYCQATSANSLEDDCWYLRNLPNTLDQNDGTQGFVDGAEYFDQNGARVAIQEKNYGEMPYRVASQSAVLETDGRARLHGGYGNIFPTFFQYSPSLDATTVIYLTRVGPSSATVNSGTSNISFPLSISLVRPVSGRLTNADIFISGPQDSTSPSFSLENVKFTLSRSTVQADGKAVGTLLGSAYKPGDFSATVSLLNPNGVAQFAPLQVTSGGDTNPTTAITSTLTITGGQVAPTSSANVSGSIYTNVSLLLPDIYRGGIEGTATLQSGSIVNDTNKNFVIEFNKTGSAYFIIGAPTSCDPTQQTCEFTGQLTFSGITGKVTNNNALDSYTTFYSPIGVSLVGGEKISLGLQLDFTANQVNILDRAPTYNFDRSSAVVRGMIFSSEYAYSPKDNAWSDLTKTGENPTLSAPVFNHTALYTPAADTPIIGGRNCENAPAADCLRTAWNFQAVAGGGVFIPVYVGADGSTSWPSGPKLTAQRAFHTSTLLPDGNILTCGGSDGSRPLSSCELMNLVLKTSSATASMNMPRANHTATLLPNGNVLVAGGISPLGVAISSAEIFYPDTQRWVPTSSMAYPRQLHTATLMPDGNVLVAGGATSSTYSATAEIYITSTSYWIRVGDMANGRAEHTATLLKNGNVLVTGGVNGFGPTKTTEVFNYTVRTFTPGANLHYARYDHTATLLRDGYVLVAGGSNASDALAYTELYDGSAWTDGPDMNYNRSNHRALLMPNGKVMVTGGEMRGTAQTTPESFDPDYRSWNNQGSMNSGRIHHTSVLTKDNEVINLGGWSGGGFLDTTDAIPFNFTPDMSGLPAETDRRPTISTGTAYFDRAGYATLLSNTSNFHGITEASGGGSGPMNSSYSNPRVYMQQLDNPSGFIIDLSTRIYSSYGSPNSSWDKTLSSITIITPSLPGVMPHGWYNVRVAANGSFSDGYTVQVTTPRPNGTPANVAGTVLGTSSITWSWDRGSIPLGGADGYNIYAASNSVFIATASFNNGNPVTYTQTGMAPNTRASIMVSPFNVGGRGSLAYSATYYTLAAAPASLRINSASFENADLEWSGSGNSGLTIYEVSMSPAKSPQFSDPLAISTPVPFSVNYLSTSTVIGSLSANQLYDFRVRAMNGSGQPTVFSNYASTVTVSGVNNFPGQALSSSTINWSWDESLGATYYEIYDVAAGTETAPVFVGSTTANNYSQTGLLANRKYISVVNAVNDTSGFGPIRGPISGSVGVYTLTVQPLPGVPNVFTNITTGTITANWITNGNSTWTVYNVYLSSAATLDMSTGTINQATYSGSATFATLSPNIQYHCTLVPVNGDGIQGTAMDLGAKFTLARVPASLTPDQISMSGIHLTWDPVDNSTGTIYELRSSTSELFADPVTTHIPFAYYYKDTSALVTGLLTATSYYFDVAARNGESVTTARKRAVVAYTTAGPSGAPSGSVGGTSDPAKSATISGTLPDNRAVSLSVPAGAFPAATAIAISSSVKNPCGYQPGGQSVAVEVFSQNGAQPMEPVTLTLWFNSDPGKNTIISDQAKLVLARYNPDSGQCLPLETEVNVGARTITATLNHFSLFQLIMRTAASGLSNVLVYPNPFYPNRGQGFVTIDRIPANSKVRIYTLSGDKVWDTTAGSTGVVIWKGVNKSGNLVASGIYLAVIDSSAGKKVLKIAVER